MATLPTISRPPRPPTRSEVNAAYHDSEMARMRWENRVQMARLGEPTSPVTSPEAAARQAAEDV